MELTLHELRRLIESYDFLSIDHKWQTGGFAVYDQRGKLGVMIASLASLRFLVTRGPAAWLRSPFNLVGLAAPVTAAAEPVMSDAEIDARGTLYEHGAQFMPRAGWFCDGVFLADDARDAVRVIEGN